MNNNNNFFQKNLAIIIIIIAVIVGIGIYYKTNNSLKQKEKKQEQQQENEFLVLDKNILYFKTKPKSNEKIEKPKYTITKENFEKIKVYVFSETDDKTLLPNELSDEKKTEIGKIKNSWKFSLNLLKKEQEKINECQKECDNFKNQLQPLKSGIEALNKQLTEKEQEKEDKNKQINNLKTKRQNITTQLQTQGKTTYNNYEINLIKTEIERLKKEKEVIVTQLMQIQRDIKNLKVETLMYENNLSNAIKSRDSLQRDYDQNEREYQNQIESSINSL